MATATLALVEVEVLGTPKRAQLTFKRGAQVEVLRTWSDGRVTIPRVQPGPYALTVQRAGMPAGRTRTVVFGPGPNRLIIPAE
jgi:hypothetical protein